jgi:hypothetical protein
MTLSADLQNPQISDDEIADDPEGHVVNVRPAVSTDVMKRSFASLDRVRYRPRDRERGEERAGAEKLSLAAMLSKVVAIRVPKMISTRQPVARKPHQA